MIIDSDVLINMLRDDQQSVAFVLRESQAHDLSISIVSYLEVVTGARDKEELRKIERFLSRFSRRDVDDRVSEQAKSLMRTYRLSHGLAVADALIAATALGAKEPLATENVRDFRFVRGLELVSPSR